MTEKAQTEKRTIRTGKRAGMKNSAKISIAMNDEDRTISRLWQIVKTRDSRKKVTAAETARRIFLHGLMAEVEKITLEDAQTAKTESERLQGDLFLNSNSAEN